MILKSALLMCLSFLLVAPVDVQAAGPAMNTQVLPVHDGGVSATATWSVSDVSRSSMKLHFSLNGLQMENVEVGNHLWHALTIDGGGLSGAEGTPGLPTISRLVEIPMGSTVTVQLVSKKMIDLGQLNLLPVQADGAESFTELLPGKNLLAVPEVRISKPAIMAGRQVVSVIVLPLAYDGSSAQTSVASDMEIELVFSGGKSSASSRPLAPSFAEYFAARVSASSGEAGALGTYLLVTNGSSDVLAHVEPLVQWRSRQGYHVEFVSTATIGGNVFDIKDAIQGVYDNTSIPPLEFISIVGDDGGSYTIPTWRETLSGYHGEGDHYYTLLDGDDILADAHIGRLSFRTLSDLDIIVNKITGYEQTPPTADTSWFKRASLMGDPSSSGITTIYVNQWLKGQLFANGWAQVDTTWGGSFASPFMSTVGSGVSAYGYRGYLGMSGISNSHISALGNGGKLAFAVLPTCDTGTFASYDACRSEAFLRAPNGGAIAAVATATTGTHTRYNNCYYHGIWDGVLNSGDSRAGVGHTLGKIELYNNYYLAEPNIAEIWAVWNNLMGDPATPIWVGVPSELSIQHPVQVSEHGQAMVIQASTANGTAVPGAVVCVYRDGETQVVGYTDEAGQTIIDLPAMSAGALQVTVTSKGFLPYLTSVTVGTADVDCQVSSAIFNDAQLNPGESFELAVSLTNFGTTTAAGVTAVLTAVTPGASVQQGNLVFGDISAGSENDASAVALVALESSVIDGQEVRWLLTSTNGISQWTSLITGTVQAGAFTVTASNWYGDGENPDPGEIGILSLELGNIGSMDALGVSAVLTTDSPWISINDNSSSYGTIAQGSSATDLLSPFRISVHSDCFAGHLAVFHLDITSGDGYSAEAEFAITIGSAATDAPTGPDSYGYYAFDNTDVNSGNAPVYDWVAIDPDHGGLGLDLGLTDFGWEQDDTETVTLPFAFTYYGKDFTEVSICSNGWLAMGETPLVHYRNYGIPSKGSPGNMIAPFWDNLNQVNNKKVYTYYDEAGHRFIVQWYEMPNHYSGAVQNFEVILLDPAHHGSGFGDGTIIFQYDQVSNTDSRDGYATVGIQNEERTDGVLYSYWNQYDATAAPLVPGRVIKFVPLGDVYLAEALVTPGAIVEEAAPGTEVVSYIHIANTGDNGSQLNYSLRKIDPAAIPAGKSVGFGNDPESETRSILNSTVTLSESEYSSGSEVTMEMEVHCVSPDMEWIVMVELMVPEGVSVVDASAVAASGMLNWNGQTGSGVTTSWGSVTSVDGFIPDNDTGHASVTLSFDPDLTGDITLGWAVSGDNYGSDPHHVMGDIILESREPFVVVLSPVFGDVVTLGTPVPVTFNAFNGPQLLDIAIQRTVGGPWNVLAENITAADGFWNWLPVGEPGSYAVIRISDAADATIFDLSGVFGIGRNLDWLQLGTTSGSLFAGNSQDVTVTLSAHQLEDGQYDAHVIITSNGGIDVVVPIQFLVSSTSGAMDVPDHVALMGNWPNPFNPQTVIRFTLPGATDVDLSVYSARGHLVAQLLTGVQQTGIHQVVWDGRDDAGRVAASGVYFYRLKTDEGNLTGKMLLAK